MPFNTVSDQIFANLLRPVLESAGYQVERADDSLHQRAIMENVVKGIERADLVVADLTGRNPNVFYELGIAHARQKDVVMIAQSTQDIPFDVSAYHVHVYPLEFQRAARFRDTLSKELRPVLDAARSGELVFKNPFTDYGSIAKPLPPDAEEAAPEGLLESMASVQRDLPLFTALLLEATELMQQITDRQGSINARAGTAPEGQEIEHALQMAADSGALWDEMAGRFEAIVERAAPLTTSIERGSIAAIRLGQIGGNDAEVSSLRQSVGKMAQSAKTSTGMLVDLAKTIRGLLELSGTLRRPGTRLASVLESLAAQMGRIGALTEIEASSMVS